MSFPLGTSDFSSMLLPSSLSSSSGSYPSFPLPALPSLSLPSSYPSLSSGTISQSSSSSALPSSSPALAPALMSSSSSAPSISALVTGKRKAEFNAEKEMDKKLKAHIPMINTCELKFISTDNKNLFMYLIGPIGATEGKTHLFGASKNKTERQYIITFKEKLDKKLKEMPFFEFKLKSKTKISCSVQHVPAHDIFLISVDYLKKGMGEGNLIITLNKITYVSEQIFFLTRDFLDGHKSEKSDGLSREFDLSLIPKTIQPFLNFKYYVSNNQLSLDKKKILLLKNTIGPLIAGLRVSEICRDLPFPTCDITVSDAENDFKKLVKCITNLRTNPLLEGRVTFASKLPELEKSGLLNPKTNQFFNKYIDYKITYAYGKKLADIYIKAVRYQSTSTACVKTVPELWKGSSLRASGMISSFLRLKQTHSLTPKALLKSMESLACMPNPMIPEIFARVILVLEHQYKCQIENVLDPCGGWMGTIIGSLACPNVKNVVGVEPNQNLREPHKKTYTLIKNITRSKACIISKPIESVNFSEDLLPAYLNWNPELGKKEQEEIPKMMFDFVGTSPPYFDREIYSQEKTQSIKTQPTHEQWIKSFLVDNLFKKTWERLKPGGFAVYNIENVTCVNKKKFDVCTSFIKQVGKTFSDAEFLGVLGVKTVRINMRKKNTDTAKGKKVKEEGKEEILEKTPSKKTKKSKETKKEEVVCNPFFIWRKNLLK